MEKLTRLKRYIIIKTSRIIHFILRHKRNPVERNIMKLLILNVSLSIIIIAGIISSYNRLDSLILRLIKLSAESIYILHTMLEIPNSVRLFKHTNTAEPDLSSSCPNPLKHLIIRPLSIWLIKIQIIINITLISIKESNQIPRCLVILNNHIIIIII